MDRFIADVHFAHKNMVSLIRDCEKDYWKIFYSDREEAKQNYLPDSVITVDDWDNMIISNWNSVVKEGDTTYVLGDIGLGNIQQIISCIEKLNGHIALLPGNHDSRLINYLANSKSPLVPGKIEILKYGNRGYYSYSGWSWDKNASPVVLSHFPIWGYDNHFHNAIHLYGHIHNTVGMNKPLIDAQIEAYKSGYPSTMCNIGCMCFGMGFTPRSLDDILKAYKEANLSFVRSGNEKR